MPRLQSSKVEGVTGASFLHSKVVWGLPVLLILLPILYPMAALVFGSVSDGGPGEEIHLTLDNFRRVLTNDEIPLIFLRSMIVAACATVGAAVPGFLLAWLVARTNFPGGRLVSLVAVASFLTPSSLSAIGWTILGNPDVGLLNRAVDAPILNIYSYFGIVFVLSQHLTGFFYLMMLAPLRNADPSYEDAARLAGASPWRAFVTVQLPLVLPALLPTLVLVFVRAFENFEIPFILGTPANIFLFTNHIFYRLNSMSPPDYGYAVALACLVTTLAALLFWFQSVVGSRRSVVTISGKGYRPRKLKLGAWTIPCMIFLVLYAFATTILPLGLILASSFFPILGLFDLSQFGIGNYLRVFSDQSVQRAVVNTLMLMIVCSTACVVLGGFVAYVISRQLPRFRAVVESVATLPLIVPGLVLGLATLWAFIRIPGLYGTLYILALAYVALGLPLGLRAISDTLRQVGPELEQASRVHGGGLWVTIRRILVPLALPGMVSAWFMIAVILSRELASSVLLYGYGSEVVSVKLLAFWEDGRGNLVAVMGVMMLVVLILLLLLERFALTLLGSYKR